MDKNTKNSLLIFLFTIFSINGLASGKEEFIVLHAPKSISFTSTEPVHSSQLADLYSTILGYTVKNVDSHLAPINPLKKSEAILTFDLQGFDGADLSFEVEGQERAEYFILENEGDTDHQFDVLNQRTIQRYSEEPSILLKLPAGEDIYVEKNQYPELLDSISAEKDQRPLWDDEVVVLALKDGTFNLSLASDSQFLTEIFTIRAFIKELDKNKEKLPGGAPEVFWITSSSLGKLIKTYGPKSLQVSEALRILKLVIAEATETTQKIYSKNVLVTIITEQSPLDLPHGGNRLPRKILQVVGSTPEPKGNPYNLAPKYAKDFHVTFWVVTFTTIMLILALLGIVMGMFNMDVGRDSIIYRSVAIRQKRD